MPGPFAIIHKTFKVADGGWGAINELHSAKAPAATRLPPALYCTAQSKAGEISCEFPAALGSIQPNFRPAAMDASAAPRSRKRRADTPLDAPEAVLGEVLPADAILGEALPDDAALGEEAVLAEEGLPTDATGRGRNRGRSRRWRNARSLTALLPPELQPADPDGAAPPPAAAGGATKPAAWASMWDGEMVDAHCGLCGIAYPGGWGDAGAHLSAAHPTEWAHIEATGGLGESGLGSNECMGCACGYTSHARKRPGGGGSWNRSNARRHRRLHSTEGAAPRAAGTLNCAIEGCPRMFRDARELVRHQEGPTHLAIPYYCPLTAEHCPRAPCNRSRGSALSLSGRGALDTHLQLVHRGHTAAAAGLDLSWAGLAAFRVTE